MTHESLYPTSNQDFYCFQHRAGTWHPDRCLVSRGCSPGTRVCAETESESQLHLCPVDRCSSPLSRVTVHCCWAVDTGRMTSDKYKVLPAPAPSQYTAIRHPCHHYRSTHRYQRWYPSWAPLPGCFPDPDAALVNDCNQGSRLLTAAELLTRQSSLPPAPLSAVGLRAWVNILYSYCHRSVNHKLDHLFFTANSSSICSNVVCSLFVIKLENCLLTAFWLLANWDKSYESRKYGKHQIFPWEYWPLVKCVAGCNNNSSSFLQLSSAMQIVPGTASADLAGVLTRPWSCVQCHTKTFEELITWLRYTILQWTSIRRAWPLLTVRLNIWRIFLQLLDGAVSLVLERGHQHPRQHTGNWT